MTLLPLLYWIVLVLSAIFAFAPLPSPWNRGNWIAVLVLFVLIGLRVFRMDI